MPSTHLSLNFHVVFSTKDREPSIAPEWRSRLHAYMGGVVTNLGGTPVAIGGIADHVHLLLGLPATCALSDVVRSLKANSSRWVHDEIRLARFMWQEGYGAFTVSPSQCRTIIEYIANQEEHHRTRSFQEEYLAFLKKCGISFDERFLW
ncbi:IS200/IS605 family transposase [Haloferula sp. BvORR071]|uniref:IS200/IS605 family transposase n=1 Tax=Haloferula sp. BvORR071 TaxID=1396141 RepID=UPI00054DF5A2|nr:IS200/IS605 family transposase [Haloferula sp. BvORR071]